MKVETIYFVNQISLWQSTVHDDVIPLKIIIVFIQVKSLGIVNIIGQ